MSVSAQQNWYTTSNGSVFIPSSTRSSSQSSHSTLSPSVLSFSTIPSLSTAPSSLPPGFTSYTTTFPTTVTGPATTYTSLAESVVITQAIATITLAPQLNANSVCIGSGTDSSSNGLLASIIIPSFIGLLIWLLFAILRPRFRQLYGLREWFVEQDLRPKPLSSSLFAFLHPPVPLVPPVPSDVSDMGESPAGDANLFPADEQLSQRAVWIALLIALGWAFLGLAGALPLYMVSIPCLANLPSSSTFSGAYSTLEDLSLMRLLRAFDDNSTSVDTANLFHVRAVASGSGDPQHLRIRVIVLTVLVLVLALLPALYKILKELSRLIAYRHRWVALRCEGKQLGWLSARHAPGFAGWGEQRFKDFVVKSGLSSGMLNGSEGTLGARPRRSPTREGEDQPNEEEKDALQVDITNIYSICDTQRLALLIDERDEILENLEIAETRYISSFRLTTPDPSVSNFDLLAQEQEQDSSRPYISHPQPLRNSSTRRPRRKRSLNPAFAASSLAPPSSFVAPSLYYKLNRVHGVSGGQFGANVISEDSENELGGDGTGEQSLSQTINARVVGSRFQEVNRNSVTLGRLPLGSHVRVDQTGELGPTGGRGGIDEHGYFSTMIPDPTRFGPNYAVKEGEEERKGEWVDVLSVVESRHYDVKLLNLAAINVPRRCVGLEKSRMIH
ncbi:hypothetical protein B0H16DRAFT_1683704 [Mycena metata]|uniref:Uncharacterized protein n=1 Tax=Mycena metata TaxID=1033252 RepID=A0AAD7K4X9_9AGAR|nr:hypothetical protein B0H16DRAFT_1683704 [Mycena metata]